MEPKTKIVRLFSFLTPTILIVVSPLLGGTVVYDNVTGTALPGAASTSPVGEMFQLGGTVGDFDGDGYPDLYFLMGANGGPNQLYINQGNGTFVESGVAWNVDDTFDGFGATAIDYDGDNDLDLFVTTIDSTNARLYRNDGGSFTDVAAAAGLTLNYGFLNDIRDENTSATWTDYDRDGDLDVYVASWTHAPSYSRNRLFKNNGNGTFTDVTTTAALNTGKVLANVFAGPNTVNCDFLAGFYFCWPRGFSPRFADMNNDGWPDLTLVCDYHTTQTYTNDKDGTFTNTTLASGGGSADWSGMGHATGDYDNDGDLDYFVGCIETAAKANAFYLNNGSGVYTNAAAARGVFGDTTHWNWGSVAMDFDNDMDLDIYVVNGWDNAWAGQPAQLFVNNGSAFFSEAASTHACAIVCEGRGAGYLDLDRDGNLDIFVTAWDEPPILLHNQGESGNHYLEIELNDPYSKNTRQIGARIKVTAGGVSQIREVDSGSNYLSHSENMVHFGMGANTTADEVRITLTDNRVLIYEDVPTDQLMEITVPPPAFSDQTVAQGVSFTHAAQADFAPIGSGGAWGDYDNDGDLDLYVGTRSGANALFQNQGGGSGFVNVAAALGVEASGSETTGAVWGDYDNDGDKDLYVMSRGDSIMFRNDGSDGMGGWTFTDVTAAIGVQAFGRTSTAAFGDYDGDGWLDLYVANHSYPLTQPMVGDGNRRDFLYHNVEGGGGEREFVNVADDVFGTTILNKGIAHSAGFTDYDNDGDLDIYVVQEDFSVYDPSLTGENLMWRNDGAGGPGGWTFTEVAASIGAATRRHPMGLAIGDYNNDGWLDMATSDINENHLYKNTAGTFTDVAIASGVGRALIPGTTTNQVSWGVLFSDYDQDGDEDFYVGAGELGTQLIQPNGLFMNKGNSPSNTFSDISLASGCNDPYRTRAVIKGDYDNDGDEDFYAVNYQGPAHLFRNDQTGGDYLMLELVGSVSNRDAIGARVKLEAAGLLDQYRIVQNGYTTNGAHDLTLHFGLNGASVIDNIEIDWPSGLTQTLTNVAINQKLRLGEVIPGYSLVARYPLEGGTATDATGNGHDGVLQGSPTTVAGVVGQGLSFDGVDDHVEIATDPALETDALTISAWVKVSAVPGSDAYLIEKLDSGNGYALRIDGGTGAVRFVLSETDGQFVNSVASPSPIVPNVGMAVTATYDGNEARLFIDGCLAATVSAPGMNIASASDIVLGANEGTSGFLQGVLDEVSIAEGADLVRGDVTANGVVDLGDLAGFVDSLVDPSPDLNTAIRPDVNGDCAVNGLDIEFEVELLLQP